MQIKKMQTYMQGFCYTLSLTVTILMSTDQQRQTAADAGFPETPLRHTHCAP